MDERGEFNSSHSMNSHNGNNNDIDNTTNPLNTINSNSNRNNYSDNRELNKQYHRYPSDREIYKDPLQGEKNRSTDNMRDLGNIMRLRFL
jgi:hypothetical protein